MSRRMASTIASASSAALTFDLVARCSVSSSLHGSIPGALDMLSTF